MSAVTIGKNERGAWCVYIDGRLISDHRTRDGAATSANQLITIEQLDDPNPPAPPPWRPPDA